MLTSVPYDYILSAVVTLLVVVDPLGLLPIFVSLTGGLTASERRAVAIRAVIIAGVTLAGFALVGDWFLRQLGISLPAFRIAGGLLLFAIAFEMVYERRPPPGPAASSATSPSSRPSATGAAPTCSGS